MEDFPGETFGTRELRRSYHDRIAAVRALSHGMVSLAVDTARAATSVMSSDAAAEMGAVQEQAAHAAALAAEVDVEVVEMLALESPVARDLRVILASRDVSQIALLCVGLGLTLARRAPAAAALLGPDSTAVACRAGEAAVVALERSAAAWTALDAPLAALVEADVSEARRCEREFFSELLSLQGVPIDVALDLGLMARAYERLSDHAGEVAERVLFAVEGRPSPVREA
jgi:phosphate transport system protein